MGTRRECVLLGLLIICSLQFASTQTEVCSTKGFYCLPNGNQYRKCEPGQTTPSPTSETFTCPSPTTCSTNCNAPSPCTTNPCPITCSTNSLLPYPGNSARYYVCTVVGVPNGEVSVSEGVCQAGITFVANTQTCGVNTSLTCTTTGYFPNPLNCSQYHICLKDINGTLSKHDYTCEGGYVFQASTANCVADSSLCKTIRVKRSTEQTEEPTTSKYDPICRDKGGRVKWEDPVNCSYFYMCVWTDGVVYPKKYRCLDAESFDPKNQRCSRRYVCVKPERAYNNDTVPGWSSEFD